MNALQLSFLLLFTLIGFSGCEADDETIPVPQEEEEKELGFNPNLANEFTYQGETQTITDAILRGDGERNPDGSITWQLYLTTDGLIEADGSFTGKGDFIFLDLNTGNPEGLVSSTYVYAQNSIPQQLSYNQVSSLYENFDILALTGTVTNIRDGDVEITVQDNRIIVEFDLNLGVPVLGQDLPLSGQFQGTLKRL